jgi:hypothetical protein
MQKKQLTLKGGHLCCESCGSLLGLQSLFLHGLKLFGHLLLYLPLLRTGKSKWYRYLQPVFRIRNWIGSGLNQASGSVSGFGIRIRIQEGKNVPQKKNFTF